MSTNLPDSTDSNWQEINAKAGSRIRNFLIVLVAIALSVSIFLGLRTETNTVDLTQLAKAATPLEVATSNGKPSLIEFYANWCTSCQAMAKDMGALEQQYHEQVNFVMLNVDNSKWLPELLKYRVDGIPHFIFMDEKGNAIAQTIGEVPPSILAANLDALVVGESLPYAQATGQVSAFQAPVAPSKDSSTDPRSHSSQAVH